MYLVFMIRMASRILSELALTGPTGEKIWVGPYAVTDVGIGRLSVGEGTRCMSVGIRDTTSSWEEL